MLVLGPDNLKQLVMLADIIYAATSATTPLLGQTRHAHQSHWGFTPGMHAVDTKLIKCAGRAVVDFREVCAVEARKLIKTGLCRPEIVELDEMMRTSGDKDVLLHQEIINSAKCWTLRLPMLL